MKKKKNLFNEINVPESDFVLTKNAYLYLIALLALIIFTQALRNPVSGVAFYAFLIFIPLNILFAFIASKGLRVNLETGETTLAKNVPFTYEISISNESLFPITFGEAYLYIPDKESVRSSIKLVNFSMPPASSTKITNTISFPYRGTFPIGIEAIYVYDFFRTVKFRIDVSEKKEVFVFPKRLRSDSSKSIVSSDSSGAVSRSPFSPEKTEVDDVREYRAGDTLKSIHWKLSSKSENFIVREYSQGTVKSNLIFVDMSARPYDNISKPYEEDDTKNPFELAKEKFLYDMNDYCIDGVVEAAVSIITKCLSDGESCIVVWSDVRSKAGYFAFQITSEKDFEKIFKLFSGAPIASSDKNLRDIREKLEYWSDCRKIYVTSAMDKDSIVAYSAIGELDASTAFGNSDMIYFSSAQRMKDPIAWRTHVEECGMQLQKKGILLKEFNSLENRSV
jgi:hypothetical protein